MEWEPMVQLPSVQRIEEKSKTLTLGELEPYDVFEVLDIEDDIIFRVTRVTKDLPKMTEIHCISTGVTFGVFDDDKDITLKSPVRRLKIVKIVIGPV